MKPLLSSAASALALAMLCVAPAGSAQPSRASDDKRNATSAGPNRIPEDKRNATPAGPGRIPEDKRNATPAGPGRIPEDKRNATSAEPGRDRTYQPVMGQKGKDVVWIPSPTGMVELMLDMAKVTPHDFVIDLGSGDGRNVIAAAKRGARALGVEYNPDLVALSRRNAAAEGLGDRAQFVQGDMFAADISSATALVLFLIPQNLEKLAAKFYAMKPGTRIVSNTYEIGGGWEPDETQRLPLCASWCGAHLYIVPAKVAGTWRLPEGDLTLEQSFQYVWGSYDYNGIRLNVENGRLRGDEISFVANGVEYSGRVSGVAMSGVAKGRTTTSWSATQVAP